MLQIEPRPADLSSHRATSRRLVAVLLLIALISSAAPYMHAMMFSKIARYDDEGYLLLAARDFIQGRRLYRDIYSPYGPVHFLYKDLSYVDGLLPVGHDLNRLQTLAEWGTAAVLTGILIFDLTGSVALAGIGGILAVGGLNALTNEPGHPQGFVVVLQLLSFLFAAAIERTSRTRLWLGLGAVLGLIVLTKVNSGIYSGVAFLLAVLVSCPSRTARNVLFAVIAACAVALPVVQMRSDIATWAGPYCTVVLAAVTGSLVVAIAHAASPRLEPVRPLTAAAVGGALSALITIALVVARGTPLADACFGWITTPLKLTNAWSLRANVGVAALPVAFLSMAFAVVVAMDPRRTATWVARLKLAVGLFIVALFLVLADSASLRNSILMSYCMPFTWLVVASPDPARRFARSMIAFTIALVALVGYPAAGSQMQMATYMLLLCGMLCVFDGLRSITLVGPRMLRAVGVVAVVFVAAVFVAKGRAYSAIYEAQTPLNLRGAERIRLPHEQAAELQWVVANLEANADRFYSLPGLNSLYLWTAQAPPTDVNVTAWMTLLTDVQQREVASALVRSPRSCFVLTDYSFWVPGIDVSDKPLMQVITTEFSGPRLTAGSFTIASQNRRRELRNYLLFREHRFSVSRDAMAAPAELLRAVPSTIELEIRTTTGGMLLSMEDPIAPRCSSAIAYIGMDGHVYLGETSPVLRSHSRIDDGRWHRLTIARDAVRDSLWIDGALEESAVRARVNCNRARRCVLGNGYAEALPAAPRGWYPFDGTMRLVRVEDASERVSVLH